LVWSRTEFPCGCARTWLSQTADVSRCVFAYLADVGVIDGPWPVGAVVDGGPVGEPGTGAVTDGPEPRADAAAAGGGEGRRWFADEETGVRW
jgi:hypothetical protein